MTDITQLNMYFLEYIYFMYGQAYFAVTAKCWRCHRMSDVSQYQDELWRTGTGQEEEWRTEAGCVVVTHTNTSMSNTSKDPVILNKTTVVCQCMILNSMSLFLNQQWCDVQHNSTAPRLTANTFLEQCFLNNKERDPGAPRPHVVLQHFCLPLFYELSC